MAKEPNEILKELLESLLDRAKENNGKSVKEELKERKLEPELKMLESIEEWANSRTPEKNEIGAILVSGHFKDTSKSFASLLGSPKDLIIALAGAMDTQEEFAFVAEQALELYKLKKGHIASGAVGHTDEVCPNCGKNHKKEIGELLSRLFS